MRGTFSILVLVAAVAAGLYFLARPDAPETMPAEATAPSPGGSDSGAEPPPTARTDPATPTPAANDARTAAPEPASIETEAAEFVKRLAEPTQQPVPVEQADHFVTQEQALSLVPEEIIERVPVHTLADDETLTPETPITVVREVEQIVIATPEQLIAEAGGDLDAMVQVPVEPKQGAAGTDGNAEMPEDAPVKPVQLIAKAEGDLDAPARIVVRPEPLDADTDGEAETAGNATAAHGAGADGTGETPESVPVDPESPESLAAEAQGGAGADGAVEAPESIPPKPVHLIAEEHGGAGAPGRVVVKPGQPGAGAGGTAEAPEGGDVEAADGATAGGGEGYELVTVRELLERMLTEPGKPISIIKKVRHFEVTTLGDLLDGEEDPDTFLNVITQPYRIEAATLADLLQKQKSEHPDSIFYVRTVRSTDQQGIWGIVHSGLTDNFARGMAVRRGEQIETYTVRIPPEADEVRHDRSSSFLGRLIHRKTRESFVYNFRENRMGQNPDYIRPGQEIVIVNFEPAELIAIYKHFTGDRG